MAENKISEIIETSLEKIRELADAETIIGHPIQAAGITIIPVSRVSVGLASGGLDYNGKKNEQPHFGGGGGTGMTVTPIAFLIIREDGSTELQPIVTPAAADSVDKITALIERSPAIFERLVRVIKNSRDSDAEQEKDDLNGQTISEE